MLFHSDSHPDVFRKPQIYTSFCNENSSQLVTNCTVNPSCTRVKKKQHLWIPKWRKKGGKYFHCFLNHSFCFSPRFLCELCFDFEHLELATCRLNGLVWIGLGFFSEVIVSAFAIETSKISVWVLNSLVVETKTVPMGWSVFASKPLTALSY